MSEAESKLRLLGHPGFAADAGAWQPLVRKDAALLARLALDGPQARTTIAAWLWPGVPLPRAHANLRQRLLRLRRAASRLIIEDTRGLQLGVEPDLARDDADFEARLLDGLPACDDACEDWMEDARRRWQARRADRMASVVEAHARHGQLDGAIAMAERLLVLEPLSEHAWRLLMRLHMRRGDPAAAVAAFERCEQVLRDELGLGPAAETVALLEEAQAPRAVPVVVLPRPSEAPALPLLTSARQALLQALLQAWRAREVVLLLGAEGMGKTTLMAAAVAVWPGALRVDTAPGDVDVPYALALRMLRALAARWSPARWGLDGPQRQELARLWPELGPPPAGPGMPAALQAALLQALAQAEAAGLRALAIDDVQRADAASLALLRSAVTETRLRWCFSARADAELLALGLPGQRSGVRRLSLEPMSDADLTALAGSAADTGGPVTAPTDLVRIIRQSGGNPMFLLELLRHRWNADDPSALPPTVEAVIQGRLAQLTPSARTLMRLVAVLGGSATPARVADAMGRPLAELADAWREAEAAQWLGPRLALTDPARRVLLAELPQSLRESLHARAAAVLARDGAPAAEVAMQWQAAGLCLRAAAAWQCAAHESLRLGRPAERWHQLQSAAQGFDDAGDAAAAFSARLDALEAALEVHGAERAFAEAGQLAHLPSDAGQRAALARARAALALACYRFADAQRDAEAALAQHVLSGADEVHAHLLQLAARAMQGVDVRSEASALLPALEQPGDPLAEARLWDLWAMIQHASAQPAASREALDRVHALARAAGHRTLELQALASRSGLRMQIGDARGAVSDAWRAARQQRRLGDRHGERASALNLAIGLIGIERLRQALAVLDAHFADADRTDDLAAIAVCVRAEVWLRAGETSRSLAVLAGLSPEALALPTRLHHGLLEAWALQAEGRADEATTCWRVLRGLTPADRGVGVALRARVLSCVVVPAAEARAELDALVIRADAAGAVAAEGIARLRRAAWALRDARPADAHADLRWLLRRRPALRHLYLPMAELEAFALRLKPDPSLRRAAFAWRDAELLPHLPPGSRAAWSSCPAWAELGGGIGPDVPGARTYSRSRLA